MLKLLGAMAALMSGAVAGEQSREPIMLVAEPADEGVRLKVVGAAQRDLEATFSLEVTGAGNRSRHNGSASLRAGERVTLSTVTLGNARPGQWQARLAVSLADGKNYEQVRTSF